MCRPRGEKTAPPLAPLRDAGAHGPAAQELGGEVPGAAASPGRARQAGAASAAELLAMAREDARLAALLQALPAAERGEAVRRDPRFQRRSLAQLFALRLASRYLDRPLAPSLAARMLLALSLIEATLGNCAAARERLQEARKLYDLSPSRTEGIARAWWEARIAAAAGQHDEAEPLCDGVRRELLARGSLAEAARITLDHVLLRIAAGRSDTVEELTAALVDAFPEGAGSWAGEMARLARLAAGEPGAVYAATQEFRRRSRSPSLPSPGRPDLLTPSRNLADRLLRRCGEHEDPLGAAPR
jgi:hypothetical protein